MKWFAIGLAVLALASCSNQDSDTTKAQFSYDNGKQAISGKVEGRSVDPDKPKKECKELACELVCQNQGGKICRPTPDDEHGCPTCGCKCEDAK